MRIEEVRLRNVRSYGNNTTVIDLRPGLNVLLGRIGCGKTSILEAILISLFGFSKAGVKKNDVLRKNATVDAMQIELTFYFDGMHFKVARGNETRLESSPDGMSWTMVSENSTEIDKFLENTLEVTARKFRDLFYAAQGELTNVITGSPEQRQKSIDKLLGAEGLRETYEHLSEFTKHFDQDIGKAEGQLKDIDSYLKRFDLDEMREEKREAEGELIRLGNEIQAITKEIAVLSGELEDLEGRAKPLEEANREIQSFRKEDAEREAESQKINYRIEDLKRQTATLAEDEKKSREKLGGLEPRARTLEEEIRTGDEDCRRLVDLRNRARSLVDGRRTISSDLESLEERKKKEEADAEETAGKIESSRRRTAEISRLRSEKQAELNKLEKALEDTQGRLPAKEEELRAAQFAVSSLGEKAKENARKITDLKSVSEGSKCPFCEQPISEDHRAKVISGIESIIKGLLRKEEAAKASVKMAEENLRSLREEAEETRSGVQQAKDEISEMNLESTREEQNATNLETFLAESQIRRDRCGEELKEKITRLEKLDEEIEAIRTESKASGDDWLGELEGLSRQVEGQMAERRRELSETNGEIAAARRILDRATQEGTRIRAEIERSQKSLGELREKIENERRDISRKFEALIGATDDPIGRVTEMISQIEAERTGKKDELNAKSIEKVQLSSDYRQGEDKVAQLTGKIDEYVSERERKVTVKRNHTLLCEARNILQQVRDRYKDAREMIRTNLINVLRELLRVEFEKLYTYEDFHDLKISDDYEVSLQSPVGEIQAHNLSAGQKAITAIAFRLAVAKAMEMKIGCWIIDEPTQNIGKAEVEALAEVLADTSKIPQIVIATHHEALGRNGNVISLGVRNGESVLGEGAGPLAIEPRGD